MHNAPPVVFPVGRFVWGHRLLWVLTAAAVAGLWCWQQWAAPPWTHVVGAVCVGCLCFARAFWLWPAERLTDGLLVWSGQAWCWRGVDQSDTPIQLQLIWDAGTGILLAIELENHKGQKQGFTRYAWLAHREMPSQWHGFRCAVYSRPDTALAGGHRAVDGAARW